MDFITLAKILPLFIYPFNVALWFLIVAQILLWVDRSRWAAACIAFAVVLLTVTGNPKVAQGLFAHHERTYLPQETSDSPTAGAIVILGGGLGLPAPPRLEADLVSTSDRLLHGARLYRAGKAPLVILSGGNVFPQPGLESESSYAAGLLQEWGVPKTAIVLEQRSRNTYQNAIYTKEILHSRKINDVLLVTSALHMPRAQATFRSAGINSTPSPTDYRVVTYNRPQALNWIPSIGAIGTTTGLMYELLGTLMYRFRGWITTDSSETQL